MNERPESTSFTDMLSASLLSPTMETPTVDRIMGRFTIQWSTTADACELRAKELEDAAKDLRERAAELRKALVIADDVKDAVAYEINARNRQMSLALVNPSSS